MKLTLFDPANHIETADDVAEYLWAAAEGNDRAHFDKAVKDALAGHGRSAEAETITKVVEWLRREAQLCDCFARKEGECACGAWSCEPGERSYKTGYVEDYADAIERGEWKA